LLAIIFLIVSFLTNVPRGRTLAGIVVGLLVLQVLLAVVSFGLPALGVLHGLNGLAIAGVAGMASRRAVQPAAAAAQPATSV
jgi:choline-glycine betaine transporter